MEKIDSILLKPVGELNVSTEFLAMAKANNFQCIQDMLNASLYTINTLPKSGYRMRSELVDLLDRYGLLHLAM